VLTLLPVTRNRFRIQTTSLLLSLALGVGPLSVFVAPASAAHRSSRSRSSALPSRGGYDRAEATSRVTTLTGRVGVISVSKAAFHRDYDSSSAVLSKVPKGTNIAILYEAGSYYGVLMADNSVGWVAKSSVQLIDYQVQVTPPAGSQAAATAVMADPVPSDAASASDPAGETLPALGGAPPPTPTGPLASAQQVAASTLSSNLPPRTTALLQEAFTYLGIPYVWGGETRRGLDCSAFVRSVFSSQGVSLPRVAADQSRVGTIVDWRDLQAGDRLYFDMGSKGRISHTGIYLGNGYFIHASTNHMRVDVDSVFRSNYYRSLVCARRSL